MSSTSRASFGSKFGIIMAAAGSAVGLGNIWRFPIETGQNGGAAFILIYIIAIALLGVPLMVAEFFIGRHAHTNAAHAYKKLSSHP
ncbi:MAG: sodium-dependent transporter, partial [Bacteroidaceae bacterium]|nr:sodium-dependent transporter [Bacteroidaceae bacterium]